MSGTDTDDAHYASLDYDAATQSSHAQFRELDLIHGRWFSPDPYDGSYDLSNPQSFNRYNYALNNPVAAIDPSGLDCADDDSCGDNGDGGDGGSGGDGGGGGGGDGGGDQGGGAPGSGGVDQPTPGCENGCVDQNGNTYQPTGSGGITDGDSTSVSVNGEDPNGISLGFLGYGPAYNGTFSGLTPCHGFVPSSKPTQAPPKTTPVNTDVVCTPEGCILPGGPPLSKEDVCHAAAVFSLVGLLTVPGLDIPVAAAWALYGTGAGTGTLGVTLCW